MADKSTIRKRILEKRDSLPIESVLRAGKSAADRLIQMEEYQKAQTIMVYMDFRNEVPTGPIIDKIRATGKTLVLPTMDQSFQIRPCIIPPEGLIITYLTISKMGIAEPNPELCQEADLSAIDLVIVPGTVFDQYENRIGYGKGCYDQFLVRLNPNAFKLGLAYDFQVLQCIPVYPTDIKMDKILTIHTNVSLQIE